MSNKQINKLNGWISLYRSIQNTDFWLSERFTKAQAWIDLLLLANRQPKTLFIRGIQVTVEKGCLAYATITLAKRWGWNKRTVSNFLKSLNKRQMIHSKTNNICTFITIRNYEDYQNSAQQTAHQSAQQSGNRMHTNNNRDKEDKENNINTEREKKQKKLSPKSLKEKTIQYLEALPEADTDYFLSWYKIDKNKLEVKVAALTDYCRMHNKGYHNPKAFLRNAIAKDYGKRDRPTVKLNQNIINLLKTNAITKRDY
jgi:hypothetical protein